jgi:hypothetical protein
MSMVLGHLQSSVSVQVGHTKSWQTTEYRVHVHTNPAVWRFMMHVIWEEHVDSFSPALYGVAELGARARHL